MAIIRTRSIECDGCGIRIAGDENESRQELRDAVRKDGWAYVLSSIGRYKIDLCPDCLRERKEDDSE